MAETVVPRNESAPRWRSGGTRLWVVIPVAMALLVGAVWWWTGRGRVSTDDAQIDGNVVPIAAKVGGIVHDVAVRENQEVGAGALLATIDTRDFEVALARAEADRADALAAVGGAQAGVPVTSATTQSQLTSTEAQWKNAEAGVQLADRQVEAARARVAAARARQREAEVTARKADQDVQRLKSLIEKDEVSRQQFDASVAAQQATLAGLDSARAAVAEAESGVLVAESRLGQARGEVTQALSAVHAARSGPQQVEVTRSRVSSAEARVAQMDAAVRQAKLNLEYTVLRAPAAGSVGRKNVEPGQVVQPGQPLMVLVPLDKVWVTANFKETQLRDMRAGQRADIHVDAYGGRVYRGRVDSIAPATGARFSLLPPENAAGNYVKVVQRVPVRVVLEEGQDPEHLLRPGMSVTAEVFTR